MLENGKFVCDRDGVDVENGGVNFALVVNDVDPDRPGHVRVLHFCRDREDKDGNKITGCASKVLSARNMEHFRGRTQKDGT